MFANSYFKKRVLVTGHTGFKGSWLCSWLKYLGAEVAGFSVNIPTAPSHFDLLGGENFIPTYWGDVRDADNLSSSLSDFQPHIVFHLAAQPLVRHSYENPYETFTTNALGVANILDSIRKIKSVRAVVIVTSDKCYKNFEWVFPYRENDILGGEDPYSASKACAEIIANSYMRSYFTDGNCLIATARAGNVIGGGDWADDRIVPDCMKAWSQGKPLFLRSPNATRPWQHVLEPLSGYLTLGAALLEGCKEYHQEAFNFGPNTLQSYSVADVIKELEKLWPQAEVGVPEDAFNNMKECHLLSLSCEKAARLLKWHALWDFVETTRYTSEWYYLYYKENPQTASKCTEVQIEKYCELAKKRGLTWSK